jgi:ABC-type nitrate/sulfonate/bicarbonate transport system substrate-binding protein
MTYFSSSRAKRNNIASSPFGLIAMTNQGGNDMTISPNRRDVLIGSAALALGGLATTRHPAAQGATPLKVMSFPGLSNYPVFAAQHKDLFAKHGLTVDLVYTPSSQAQRDALADNECQIAHTAADNAVAMVELGHRDAIIVTGGDSGFNRILAQPEIKSLADLRGKTVVVDAPNTAYALLLYKALKTAGLNKGDYAVNAVGGTTQRMDAMMKDREHAAAAVINVPFNFRLEALGMTDLGSATKSIGAYQAGSVVVMRDWAKANSDALVRYIAAIIEGRRWLLDPANKEEAVKLAVDRVKLSPDIATRAYDYVIDPKEGFHKDAQFDVEGFNNVLKLRAEIEGQWGGKPPAADKYVELSYYNKAIASL